MAKAIKNQFYFLLLAISVADFAKAQQAASFRTEIHGKDTLVIQVPVVPGARLVSYTEPRFNGSLEAFWEKHLKLPLDKNGKAMEGVVTVLFNVRINGTIEQPRVIKSTNDALNETALQLIVQMPPWLPALMDQQPIDKATVVLEVPFRK